MRKLTLACVVVAANAIRPALGPAVGAQETTIYVDSSIGAASCMNYNPTTRTCSGGTATAYRTISGAASVAGPGSTVSLRGGTYQEQLTPPTSGTAVSPIIFRAYSGETPTISNLAVPGILLARREYIEIDGLTVTDVVGWARLEDSRSNTIRNSTFRRATATGTTGSIKLVRSTFNRLLDNLIEDGNDNIVLVDAADRNLIQGNTVSAGRHSLLTVRCSNFNVFRGNNFANPSQKAIEIFDCEGVGSDSPIRYDATKHNLLEANNVTKTLASDADHRYNGIQHGGQFTIVRRNVFRNNDGGAVNYQEYSNESVHVHHNRMYNNTFYANRCHAIIGDLRTANYYDQRVKNNLLYRNVTCSGGATQIRIPDTNAVILTNNAIETTSPGFVNEAGNDFRLAAGSRMIDAGAPLTSTVAAGSGISLQVQDATYFFDGYTIPGETGDVIQLGASQTAIVTAINYTTNTLVLDRPLTWSSGQGVSLRYTGNAMDMGAFEYGSATTPAAPQPPTNLRIIK